MLTSLWKFGKFQWSVCDFHENSLSISLRTKKVDTQGGLVSYVKGKVEDFIFRAAAGLRQDVMGVEVGIRVQEHSLVDRDPLLDRSG